MCETRIIVCRNCGGDGGWDEPSYRFGGDFWDWYECGACNGEGDVEVEVEPIDEDDLFIVPFPADAPPSPVVTAFHGSTDGGAA